MNPSMSGRRREVGAQWLIKECDKPAEMWILDLEEGNIAEYDPVDDKLLEPVDNPNPTTAAQHLYCSASLQIDH